MQNPTWRIPVTVMLLLWLPSAAMPISPLKADEEVLFFPQSGYWDSQDKVWRIPVHGWVFEREEDSLWRRFSVEGVEAMMGIGETMEDEELFKSRVWPFLVDNERNKKITVRYLGDKRATFASSGANGHFEATLLVDETLLKERAKLPWVVFEVDMPTGDERHFEGSAQLLCPYGLSVISDVDDTIKISNVLDKEELLANTFMREFRAVPSMSGIYRKWMGQGAAFHYVSASPWQLYQPLAAFLSDNGFPIGSFHLRPFRLKDSSFLNIFTSSAGFKKLVIEEILQTYPQRRFVLVGDNGEKDPEIYGGIAVHHPQQVIGIYIRNVTGESRESERIQAAFEGVAENKWWLFRVSTALDDVEFPQGREGGERGICASRIDQE